MWTLLLSVLLWATVKAWYMPMSCSCVIDIAYIIAFLNEINGDGDLGNDAR